MKKVLLFSSIIMMFTSTLYAGSAEQIQAENGKVYFTGKYRTDFDICPDLKSVATETCITFAPVDVDPAKDGGVYFQAGQCIVKRYYYSNAGVGLVFTTEDPVCIEALGANAIPGLLFFPYF